MQRIPRLFLACIFVSFIQADDDLASTESARGCAKGVNAYARPDFLPFSQGEQRSRDYMGQTRIQNLADMDDWNWVISAAFYYDQNFSKKRIGEHLSPSGTYNCFTVGQNGISNIHLRNVDLGLSHTFHGKLCLKPEIKNFILEPSCYVGLDRWLEGLFLWFKVPITWSHWDLNLCETTTSPAGPNFATNVMDDGNDPVEVGASSIIKAFNGSAKWGDKTTSIQSGRMLACGDSQVGVADLPVHIGWNFIKRDGGYGGIYMRTVFPTGSKNNRQSIFDPRVGYDRWQLGGGLQTRIELFNIKDETTLNAFFDFYATHIFSDKECRLFDKVGNGVWSRYLLLKEFNASNTYTGILKNFADVFTVCIKSGFDWNISLLTFFELEHNGWHADLGYELKVRTCEEFDSECLTICNPKDGDECEDACLSTSTSVKYGIKGIQNANDDRYDNAATIITTSLAAGSGTVATSDATGLFRTTDTPLSNIVDIESGRRPGALSHKIFGNISHTWQEREYPVFTSIGAKVELGNKNKALRNWGIWGKMGVTYS